MKQLKNYLKNLPFMSKVNSAVIAFMLLIFLLVAMCSCGVSRPIEKRPDFEIEWTDTITLVPPKGETLLVPNINDGKIVGISRNGKKYKIEDGFGNPAGKMKTDSKPDSSMIGTFLICKNEFR